MYEEDTIAAVATASGEAGIGIVRVSGPRALAVGDKVFRARRNIRLSKRPSHTVTYGWVISDEAIVDEALALIMKGPRSYTGEDVVEFHCHGGQVPLRKVLQAVLGAGSRLSEPGEFTRRAFMHGRIDLSQAEAVIDIIRAKTDRAMDAAVRQLQGELSAAVRQVRDRLLEMMTHLEADIDFPELELEVQTQEQVRLGCVESLNHIRDMLVGARQGRLLRDGVRIAIVGRPNVGKSSLMNRLVREDRSIVTEIPGTTRDVVEEWIHLHGVPAVLSDTAGIHDSPDPIERLGMERTRTALVRADLVLFIIDGAFGLTEADRALYEIVPERTSRLIVVNKADIMESNGGAAIQGLPSDADWVAVSALTGYQMEKLEARMAEMVGVVDKGESFVANSRQEESLRRAQDHLDAALFTAGQGLGTDMIAIDIRSAWAALGEITGETVGEDLLDQIFSRFCIGK